MPPSIFGLLLLLTMADPVPKAGDHPLAAKERTALATSLDRKIAALDAKIKAAPDDAELLMQRGTANFFRGKFAAAAADYDRTIELDPKLKPSHWQRGIALYYAQRYEDSAAQFDLYHSFDNVDRENGIWRFLAQAKSLGIEKAREKLLDYRKEDRPPLGDVYAMFAGTRSPDDLLALIRAAKLGEEERAQRLFYAELYVGLYHDARGEPEPARKHLREAVANTWGKGATGGPGYMWHVARVHYEFLAERK